MYRFSTVFHKIVNKQIPSQIVLETNNCLAFKDLAPKCQTHILIIPKNMDGLDRIQNATSNHKEILGELLLTASQVAKQQGLKGFRIIINDGPEGGQTVPYLHLHLLGGTDLPGFH